MNLPTAVDLFAGAGGATQGLKAAGFRLLGAVENDPIAASTYRLNHPEVVLWESDIRLVPASRLKSTLGLSAGELTLLKACPPCQGFSTLAGSDIGRSDDPRNDLVADTVRFVRALLPKSVLIENVPGLGRDSRSEALVSNLEQLGYAVRSYVVDAADFGVPQHRKRFIVLAVKGKRTRLPDSLSDPTPLTTVREAFKALESVLVSDDPLSVAVQPSQLVQQRIKAIPVGGTRFDLPVDLQLECHKKLGSSRSASGSYRRMQWDAPAATMTTRCTTPACGPYIHPSLDRPITLREAAAIQTFPANYVFAGTRGQVERQIGNAVPVLMVQLIAGKVLSTISARAA